jgi:hypothetical protein
MAFFEGNCVTAESRPRPALPDPPIEDPPPGQNLLVTNFNEGLTDYEIGLRPRGEQAEIVTVLPKVTEACVGW